MISSTHNAVFTVSRLNTTVRQLLEMEMGRVWLSGEISNFSQPSSGHWYFTLKDERAQVKCAMFRGANRNVTFRPQNGQQVLVRANITLYEPRGDYQIIVESLQPAGEGLLQQQFEQLKKQLHSEGLFDQRHKQPLPQPVKTLGIVTSKSGAALHDIIQVLQRRDPSLPIVIYPTMVQGSEAAATIVRAIELANQRNECDLLIVGRGGGSLEDLFCFNDERVARAIFASRIPVVSAVGHETDTTIADYVADLRAPTPSAAAEMVSRNQQELVRQLQQQQQRMTMAMDYYLSQRIQGLAKQTHRLQQQHPQLRLVRQQTKFNQLSHRLTDAMQRQLKGLTLRSKQQQQRLMQVQPLGKIYRQQQQVQQYQHRITTVMTNMLNQRQQRFAVLCSQLNSASPLTLLQRGYSVAQTQKGNVLKQHDQVNVGDMISTRLIDGVIESQVTAVKAR